ncbi:MAG: succinylglutamate desuccinylase [Ignavibacteria bacterium]|nr:succinylglutamate desuccinylase [Ignavibacteria bacterium]
MIESHRIRAILFLVVAAVGATIAALEFRRMHELEKIVPGPGVTTVGRLSDYLPNLRDTNGDTPVFFLEGSEEGETVLVLGGTHANEPAGFVAAVVLIENVTVSRGRLIVIPQANRSGFTCTDPLEGYPQRFSISTGSGERWFRFGSRGANPLDHWPDPLVYLHQPSGQRLSGVETRNLNRSYPGRPDGSFTERIGYAIMQLIEQENVRVAFDFHEASPEIPIVNALVTHEKGKDIAAAAILNLELENLEFALEFSPPNFRGLSHREWGDRTDVYPFLMESSNPIQGRLRGPTSAELLLGGVDLRYRRAKEVGKIRITYHSDGEPLDRRVGRHLQSLRAVLDAYAEEFPERSILLGNLPNHDEIVAQGVGVFLK